MEKYKSYIIKAEDIKIDVETLWNGDIRSEKVTVIHLPTGVSKTVVSEVGQIDAYNTAIMMIEDEVSAECKYCKEGAFITLFESTQISNMIWLSVGHKLEKGSIIEDDNSVVFEMRNGSGYIRLGDRGDMNCLDTEYKFEVKNCIGCGRKLGGE